MNKSSYKYFQHVISAMIFIPVGQDKSILVAEWFELFKSSGHEDPALWVRDYFADKEDFNGIYIRDTFDN